MNPPRQSPSFPSANTYRTPASLDGVQAAPLICLTSNAYDMKGTRKIPLFTIPSGYTFLLESCEGILISANNVTTYPWFSFGYRSAGNTTQNFDNLISGPGFARVFKGTTANSRHVVAVKTAAIASGCTIGAQIKTAATGTAISGRFMITGYLIPN